METHKKAAQTLELLPNENPRKAWIRYMFKNHPDINLNDKGSNDRAALGNECYGILRGKIKKSAFFGELNEETKERISFSQKYAKQYGSGLYNY